MALLDLTSIKNRKILEKPLIRTLYQSSSWFSPWAKSPRGFLEIFALWCPRNAVSNDFLLKIHDINGGKLHLTLQKHISRGRILDLTLVTIDVDECTMNTDNCHEDAFCTNKIGSFNCTCNPGYEGNGTNCTDIDECTIDTHNCHDDATCKNTKGSFNCTCNSGFDGNGTHCDGKYLILLL